MFDFLSNSNFWSVAWAILSASIIGLVASTKFLYGQFHKNSARLDSVDDRTKMLEESNKSLLSDNERIRRESFHQDENYHRLEQLFEATTAQLKTEVKFLTSKVESLTMENSTLQTQINVLRTENLLQAKRIAELEGGHQ